MPTLHHHNYDRHLNKHLLQHVNTTSSLSTCCINEAVYLEQMTRWQAFTSKQTSKNLLPQRHIAIYFLINIIVINWDPSYIILINTK